MFVIIIVAEYIILIFINCYLDDIIIIMNCK